MNIEVNISEEDMIDYIYRSYEEDEALNLIAMIEKKYDSESFANKLFRYMQHVIYRIDRGES